MALQRQALLDRALRLAHMDHGERIGRFDSDADRAEVDRLLQEVDAIDRRTIAAQPSPDDYAWQERQDGETLQSWCWRVSRELERRR